MKSHSCLDVKADCLGGDSCCTGSSLCGEGEGDCDEDRDCAGDLVCGTDNCSRGPLGQVVSFDFDDDCCEKVNTTAKKGSSS